MFDEPCRTARRRKWRREVEVEAGVDSLFPGDCRGPLRILHEDHGAHRRDGPTKNALKGPVGGLVVPSPIVGVDDEETGLRRPIASVRRLAGQAGDGRKTSSAGGTRDWLGESGWTVLHGSPIYLNSADLFAQCGNEAAHERSTDPARVSGGRCKASVFVDLLPLKTSSIAASARVSGTPPVHGRLASPRVGSAPRHSRTPASSPRGRKASWSSDRPS